MGVTIAFSDGLARFGGVVGSCWDLRFRSGDVGRPARGVRGAFPEGKILRVGRGVVGAGVRVG